MKHPKVNGLVSIIVPIYNNETHLGECLDSILAQTFTNWEAVLVNDGSTDSTAKIIDEYAKKDLRFVVIHKQNEGTLSARRTGLENSRGEFIANIDHDDTYHPQFLEKMFAKITETNADFVWCECQFNYDLENPMLDSYRVTDYKWSENISKNVVEILTIKRGMCLVTWDKLIKRDVYTKVLFPCERIILGEDPIQTVQIAYHSKSAAFIAENLYYHKLDGVSTTPKTAREVLTFCIIQNEILDILFSGAVPKNVQLAQGYFMNYHGIPITYINLDKQRQAEFKDKLKPFLPKCIKYEKRFFMKIALLFANAGIYFPFNAGKFIKKVGRKIKSIFV